MKSINEKAEERAPYTKTDSLNRIKAAINAQTSFEAGANYVLDEIENSLQEFTNYEDSLIIRRIIEELKKIRL